MQKRLKGIFKSDSNYFMQKQQRKLKLQQNVKECISQALVKWWALIDNDILTGFLTLSMRQKKSFFFLASLVIGKGDIILVAGEKWPPLTIDMSLL